MTEKEFETFENDIKFKAEISAKLNNLNISAIDGNKSIQLFINNRYVNISGGAAFEALEYERKALKSVMNQHCHTMRDAIKYQKAKAIKQQQANARMRLERLEISLQQSEHDKNFQPGITANSNCNVTEFIDKHVFVTAIQSQIAIVKFEIEALETEFSYL
jgi:hypothetical protein